MTEENNATDRLLKATRHALNRASFHTNQYKQVVQKKIDLGSIHKKIEQLHTALGEQVGNIYQAGTTDISHNKEAARLLEKLLSLKQAAALLEEEIELIRTESPSAEPPLIKPEPDRDSSHEKN